MAGNASDLPFISENREIKVFISRMVAEELRCQMAEKDGEIDFLKSKIESLGVQLEEHRNKAGRDRAHDRKRITELEERNKSLASETANAHIDRLHKLMLQSRMRQISIANASNLLNISKTHAHRLKSHLKGDSRFAIVKDPRHKQRELIMII